MIHRRIAIAAAGAAAIALLLTGCSLFPQSASNASSAPKVGQCWNATLAQADAWADWKGAAATSCSSTHVLYTYGIGQIKDVTSDDWTAKGSKTELDATISADASKTCNSPYEKLLPNLTWSQQLVQSYFFVPTQAEWKAGARWVRCDVGVLATGVAVTKQALSELPTRISTFTNLVNDDPERFNYCVNTQVSVKKSGPLDTAGALVADCTKNPQWELESYANFPDALGAPFPSATTVHSDTSEACTQDLATQTQVWVAYIPSKSQWKTGDREIDCWVGSDVGAGSPTTA